MSKRVMLTVAYDGTQYHGWQIQPNVSTIEGILNRNLSEMLGEPIEVIGASRTDAGVHSLGNIAVFDTNARIPAEKISYALNQRLPEDIKIRKSEEVTADFHPRKVESRKTYEYRIWHDTFPMPTERLDSYFVYTPLNIEAMKKAARYLEGEHDFTSFCSVHTEVENKVRTIYKLEVLTEEQETGNQRRSRKMQAKDSVDNQQITGGMIRIRVTGNGFLYHMVRILAGTLLEVGKELYPPEHIEEILEAHDREAAGPTVPAHGLTMISYKQMHFAY